jgi:hypothetical protein
MAACSSARPLYSDPDPQSDAEVLEVFDQLNEDTRVGIVLDDGSRFHARYRGTSVRSPCFDDLEWKETAPDRDTTSPEGVWMFSAVEIHEVSRLGATTGDWIVGTLSLTILIAMLASYGHVDG